ncbi:unnamed protein product, partial [marine sediment metagenome]
MRHAQIHAPIVNIDNRVLYGSFAERAKSAIDLREQLQVR